MNSTILAKESGYPSTDQPWLQFYQAKKVDLSQTEQTVYDSVLHHNQDNMNATAIRFFGFNISYAKMFEQVEACAKALKKAGVKRGDRVTLCTAGVPEAIYIVLACSRIGAIANFINPLFTTEQKIERINFTGSDFLFILDKMYSYISEAIDKTCTKKIIIMPVTNSFPAFARAIAGIKEKADASLTGALKNDSRYMSWNQFIKTGADYTGSIDEPYVKDTPVVMVYSSGTTGASKGIVLTNNGINSTIAFYLLPEFHYERSGIFLQLIPVWFSTGIVLSLLMPLSLGMTVIPEPAFSKESFVRDLIKYKPNLTLATTSFWVYAMHCKELKSTDLSFLSYPLTGGEQVLPQVENELNRFLAEHGSKSHLNKGYGMCELGSTITSTSPTHNKIGSVGFPLLGSVVAAFDLETNQEMPFGKRGEIRVLTASHMKEYYQNPEATEEFFKTDDQGRVWGCTGDIGYVDQDGDIFILGRASDSYCTEDEQRVFLFDAEYAILNDPAIALCKVVDISIHGKTVPVAHVMLSSRVKEDHAEVIRRISALCEKNLQDYAVPQFFKIREAFPVHPNGKRDNESLRKDRKGFFTAEGQPVDTVLAE
ncbi:MAG: acyl--CoA ligase [Butyrivibrio sp.]|nr:acyl--CoA ligase [Butyrivibrio sp.]